MPQAAATDQRDNTDLAKRYRTTRELSVALASPLSEADAVIQSMEDA